MFPTSRAQVAFENFPSRKKTHHGGTETPWLSTSVVSYSSVWDAAVFGSGMSALILFLFHQGFNLLEWTGESRLLHFH